MGKFGPSMAASSGKGRILSAISLVIRALIVIGCVYYVVNDIDFGSVVSLFSTFDPAFVALAFGVGLLQFFVQGWRLNLLTSGRVRVRSGIAASLVCVGLNSLLPAKIGELGKIAIMKEASGVSWDEGLRAVFWERFLDLNVLSLMCVLLTLLAPVDSYLALVALVTIALWVVVLVVIRWAPRMACLVEKIPFAFVRKVLLFFISAFSALPAMRVIVSSSVATVILWGCMFLPDAVSIRLVAGLDLTVLQLLVVFIVSVVGYSIPSSPGSLGVFDAALILGLGWFGVPKSEGLAMALLLRMVHYIPSVSFTVLYMICTGMSLKKLYKLRAE